MRMHDLRPGWRVVGNDDGRVGTIRSVGRSYVVVSRSGLASDLYVPVTFIAMVESETIHLTIPQRDADRMGWEQEPRTDESVIDEPEDDLHRHI